MDIKPGEITDILKREIKEYVPRTEPDTLLILPV